LEISVYHWYLWNYRGYCFFINPQTLKIGIDQKKCFLIKLSVKPKEWVSDCCLMLFQQLFSYIMARTKNNIHDNFIDISDILRFPSDLKLVCNPVKYNLLFNYCDVTVPTSS
jgi:hypothetical protein